MRDLYLVSTIQPHSNNMNIIENFTPPLINGVSASKVFLPNDLTVNTVFEYLCQHFPHIQPQEWQQRFADQLIYAADGSILTLESPYTANTHIFYYRFLAHEKRGQRQRHVREHPHRRGEAGRRCQAVPRA